MTLIRGGTFRMGSESFYPEERPVREVEVDDFWMDEHPVTAAEYRRFVRAVESSRPGDSGAGAVGDDRQVVAYASTPAAGAAALGLGGFATLVLIVLLGLLALLWIVALFLIVMDSISIGAKILWFLFVTLLAPIGIPAYFIARSRRQDRVEARPA